MAATNLVKDQDKDHVKRIAEFAVEAVERAGEIPVDIDDPSMGYVKIRVGFHSGVSMTLRVVAQTMFRFLRLTTPCVFGFCPAFPCSLSLQVSLGQDFQSTVFLETRST